MPKYEIPNLANACRILTLLTEEREALSIGAIARALEIPRTSTLRIISTLCSAGFLQRTGEGIFTLGPGLIPLGLQALERLDTRAIAKPVLRELTVQTQETAHLAILSQNKMVIAEVVQCSMPIRSAAPAGSFFDLYCTAASAARVGKANTAIS